MIKSSISFLYNNISSKDMGVINASINSGLYEENFLPKAELKETVIRRRKIPYLLEIRRVPLEFTLTIAFQDVWTTDSLSAVKRWFYVDFYSPMIFEEDPNIYFCMPINQPKISHNGSIGYFTIDFRCNSPYSYSPTFLSPLYDLTINPTSTNIILVNNGDITLNPTITAQIISGTSFSISNLSNGGQSISFTGLAINEIVTIDCENEEVFSSISSTTYRINNMTGNFLDIVRGSNTLQVIGNIKLQFEYQFMLLP